MVGNPGAGMTNPQRSLFELYLCSILRVKPALTISRFL